jgi:hypothetical protein
MYASTVLNEFGELHFVGRGIPHYAIEFHGERLRE